MRRTRLVAAATATAVIASGVVSPSAFAQEETDPTAETAPEVAAPEESADPSESEAPEAPGESTDPEAPGESEDPGESDPTDEPEVPAQPAQIDMEIKIDKSKQLVTRQLETDDQVAAALAGHDVVGWSIKNGDTPLGFKFNATTATITIEPGQLRDKTPQVFVATDLDTGETVAEVTVTVEGVQDAPINPGNKITKTKPRDIAIIAGVGLAIVAALAGMVQAFVPGGWQQVISYFSGNR